MRDEAARLHRLADDLSRKGKHEDAAAWRDLARRTERGLDKTHDYFRL